MGIVEDNYLKNIIAIRSHLSGTWPTEAQVTIVQEINEVHENLTKDSPVSLKELFFLNTPTFTEWNIKESPAIKFIGRISVLHSTANCYFENLECCPLIVEPKEGYSFSDTSTLVDKYGTITLRNFGFTAESFYTFFRNPKL